MGITSSASAFTQISAKFVSAASASKPPEGGEGGEGGGRTGASWREGSKYCGQTEEEEEEKQQKEYGTISEEGGNFIANIQWREL